MKFPNFNIDKLPTIRIKSISYENYKVFEKCSFDFTDNDIKKFICFIGPNGYGKSTVLHSLSMLFANFNSFSEDRLKYNLGKSVRHSEYKNHILSNDDFLVTAKLYWEEKNIDYDIQINRNGFIKDHPSEIKELTYRLCYATKFDQELHNFQLVRSKWDLFKSLFESVTGFEIEEYVDVFDSDENNIAEKYVCGFYVHKPRETILHRECSDGERKIIKSFSTLLNLQFTPQIILIDNVEMHVESGRHMKLIKSMKECYPNSQIFTTTHSYHISRNFSERSQVYDLRIINSNDIIKSEPWRLNLKDELNDCIIKLEHYGKQYFQCILDGRNLIKQCEEKIENKKEFKNNVEKWMNQFNAINIKNITE